MCKIECNVNTLEHAEIGTLIYGLIRENSLCTSRLSRLEYQGGLGPAAVKTSSIKGCKQTILRCCDSLNINCSAVEAVVLNKVQKSSQALCLCWKAVIRLLV